MVGALMVGLQAPLGNVGLDSDSGDEWSLHGRVVLRAEGAVSGAAAVRMALHVAADVARVVKGGSPRCVAGVVCRRRATCARNR